MTLISFSAIQVNWKLWVPLIWPEAKPGFLASTKANVGKLPGYSGLLLDGLSTAGLALRRQLWATKKLQVH